MKILEMKWLNLADLPTPQYLINWQQGPQPSDQRWKLESEVICIGVVEKVVGLGECGGKEVEQGRRYADALSHPYPGMKGEGEGKVISSAAVRSSKQEDNQHLELLLRQARVSARMSLVWLTNDHAKSFVKINCRGQCAEWVAGLIKALSYFIYKRQDGGYGGVVGTESMFGWVKKKTN